MGIDHFDYEISFFYFLILTKPNIEVPKKYFVNVVSYYKVFKVASIQFT